MPNFDQINQITLNVALIIGIIFLWRAYIAELDKHMEDLRTEGRERFADLQTRVMLIEDALNITRATRIREMQRFEDPDEAKLK